MPAPNTASASELSGSRYTLLVAAAIVCFYVLGVLEGSLSVDVTGGVPLWLPSGLSIALMFRLGLRAVPMVFVGNWLALALVLDTIAPMYWLTMLAWSLPGAGLLTFQAVLMRALYFRLTDQEDPFSHDRAFLYWLASLTVACFVVGLPFTLGTYLLLPQHDLPWLETWLVHSLADACGALALMPAIYLALRRGKQRHKPFRLWELTCWITIGLLVSGLNLVIGEAALFLLLPLLVWSVARFHDTVTGAAIFALSLLVFYGALHSADSAANTDITHLILLQFLLMVIIATVLYLSTLFEQRSRSLAELETMVEERTHALRHINQELQDEIFVRQQTELSLRDSSERYQAVVETAATPIIVVDNDLRVCQWNSAAASLYGTEREQAIGQAFIERFVAEPYRNETRWKIEKALTDADCREMLETDVETRNDGTHTLIWTINGLQRVEQLRRQVILVGQDISEIRDTQNRLQFLAHYDPLTNTANRRLFEERCRQALNDAVRNRYDIAIIMLDIDHFKRINDILGHDAGDDLLVTMAERLKSCVRQNDTVARLGGDEFAVLIQGVKSAEACERVASNIIHAISQPIQLPTQDVTITSSLGITVAPADGDDYVSLLKHADMAMYKAKQAGRNRFQFFSEDMNAELRHQIELERDLREAMESHQFTLSFQPVVCLKKCRVMALEVLLRWQHPEKGLIHPADFLHTAEQSGLLLPIGEWVLHNACLNGKAIQAMSDEPVCILVNLSEKQYHNPDLVKSIHRILAETRFNPTCLALEINESSVMGDAQASQVLNDLKALGISLTLDNFGTGYSSLRDLKSLPIDSVKIDRSFTQGVPDDPQSAALSEAIVSVADRLGLETIVEGIETPEQERFFAAQGCHLAQGFLYARPVSSEQLPALFRASRSSVHHLIDSNPH